MADGLASRLSRSHSGKPSCVAPQPEPSSTAFVNVGAKVPGAPVERSARRAGGNDMQGCCVDKECTPETCMELPAGKMCGDCVHERRCCLMFGHKPSDTYCDWFPRKFREKPTAVPGGR